MIRWRPGEAGGGRQRRADGASPIDWHVQRWDAGLPQYTVGHVDRVARIRADIARQPGIAVCGAAYDGIGIAPCVASAMRAAHALAPAVQ